MSTMRGGNSWGWPEPHTWRHACDVLCPQAAGQFIAEFWSGNCPERLNVCLTY